VRAGSFAPRDLARARHISRVRLGAGVSSSTVAVIVLTAAAAGLRFYRLGHQGFWYDEANSSLLVRMSPGRMLGLLGQNESTPPLYYCLAWVWVRAFGSGEAGLRSLSALAGVAVVPVAYGIGAVLATRRVGLVAAALAATNPLLIWYSQEARSYSLLVLLSAVSLLAFAWLARAPSRRWLIAWGAASGLALCTHYYAIVAVVPQALWLLWAQRRSRSRRDTWIAVGAVAAVGAALIPLALTQNANRNDRWIARIPLGPRLGQLGPQLLLGPDSPARTPLVVGVIVLVLAAVVLAICRTDAAERGAARLGAGLAVAGLVLILFLIAVGIDDLITRNVVALWVPAALAVSAGLGARRAGWLGLGPAALLCAAGIFVAGAVASDRYLQRPDWRVVAQALGPPPAPGAPARAILVQRYLDLLPLSLYMPGLTRLHPGDSVRVGRLDVISIKAPHVALCWWGAACNLSGSPAQRSYPIAGLAPARRRHRLQFTITTLNATRPVALTVVTVAAGLRTTTSAQDEILIQRPR
jgi:mannosyltransferase